MLASSAQTSAGCRCHCSNALYDVCWRPVGQVTLDSPSQWAFHLVIKINTPASRFLSLRLLHNKSLLRTFTARTESWNLSHPAAVHPLRAAVLTYILQTAFASGHLLRRAPDFFLFCFVIRGCSSRTRVPGYLIPVSIEPSMPVRVGRASAILFSPP